MQHWTDFTWLAMGCTAALLGAIHLSIWVRQRQQRVHVAFALLSFSVTASSIAEWLAMHAQTTAEYAHWLRLCHACMLPATIAFVIFVHILGPVRRWMAIAAVGTRIGATLANHFTGVNLSFAEITALRPISIWGDHGIATPIGIANPWLALGQLSALLLIVLVVDLMFSLRRVPPSPQRARVLRVAAALLAFIVASMVWHLSLVLLGKPLPATVTPFFLGIVLVMSYELSGDVLRAAQLSQKLNLAESSLRSSRNELQLAERAAGLGIWRWDVARGEVWVSDRGAQILGLATGGGSYDVQQIRARIEVADLAQLDSMLDRVRRLRGCDLSTELRVQRSSGASRWLAVHGQIDWETPLDEPVAHGIVFDQSERRRANEQFRLVVDASPTAMLLVETSGQILLANSAIASLSGYSASELVGLQVEVLVADEQRELHPAQRGEFLKSGCTRQMQSPRDVLLRRKDGSHVAVEIALSPVQAPDRMLTIAAISDISERRAMDRELGMQRDAMAHLSRVGMLSELSGSLAHELNQPLAAILSNAQASMRFLNRAEPDLTEVREGLGQIIDSDKRAGEIIRRLRAMLRKEPPDLIELEVNEVLRDVLRLVRSDLIDRHVVLIEDFGNDLPNIRGDRVQLQQVILNLIRNASDAMREQSGGRLLRLSSRPAPGGVLLQVVDTGPGIPEADIQRIFEPFVSSKADGLGFGLSLCTTLVDAHGGKLWASNNADRGATLHVFLPGAG